MDLTYTFNEPQQVNGQTIATLIFSRKPNAEDFETFGLPITFGKDALSIDYAVLTNILTPLCGDTNGLTWVPYADMQKIAGLLLDMTPTEFKLAGAITVGDVMRYGDPVFVGTDGNTHVNFKAVLAIVSAKNRVSLEELRKLSVGECMGMIKVFT